MLRLPATLVIFATGFVAAQSTNEEFEVATIKPTAPEWSKGRFIRMESAHQFVARNHALKTLIAAAYNVSPRAISGGPAWIDSDRYDILAKTPGGDRPSLEEQMAMLRKLLVERFQLTFHREQREMPIYSLTIAKSGLKIKQSAWTSEGSPQGPPPLIFVVAPQLVHLPGRNATMGELASVMQRAALDRPVVDQTGLPGRYDFELEWTPDETQFGGALGKPSIPEESTRPGLFTAMEQQLGLKLLATKGPVLVFVINQAQRPSEN